LEFVKAMMTYLSSVTQNCLDANCLPVAGDI